MKTKTKAPQELVPFLREMYLELVINIFEANQVVDNRATALENKNIWVKESSNPKWYSELLEKYPKYRKNWSWKAKAKKKLTRKDSIIKRGDIGKILLRLSKNKSTSSKDADDLIEIARKTSQKRTAVSEVEFIFYEVFGILISDEEKNILEDTHQDQWKDIAEYHKQFKKLPDWINGEPPF